VSAIFHRAIKKTPPYIKHGEGIYLVDQNGKRYVDASGGPGVSSLGHGHPKIIEAVKRQLDRIDYVHYLSFTNDTAELLGKRLVEAAPDGFGRGRALFVGSGSEATEAAGVRNPRPLALARSLADKHRCHVVITLGSHGMVCAERESGAWYVPAESVEVRDVCGAGDTVLAAIGAAMLDGDTFREACRFATGAAGRHVAAPRTSSRRSSPVTRSG